MKLTFAPRPFLPLTLLIAAVIALPSFAAIGQAALTEGAQQFAELGTCKLESGQEIADCRIGYRTWGTLNAAGTNAVLAPTWFTGTSEGLSNALVKTKIVDPARYFVIVIDALGDGVSSSPSNSKSQPRMQFPAFTTRDMVNTEYRLAIEVLKLKHLHAVIGISMGGMQTFEWMVDYPDFMDLAVPIVGSTRLTAYDLLLWHAEEDATKADPAWKSGNYEKSPPLLQVSVLHDMNLSTPAHYAREIGREGFAARYEMYRSAYGTDFDANDRLYQLEAMIHHDIAHGGSMEAAAKLVKASVLVVPSEQDHMVNPGPALDFAKLLGAKVLLLTSDCGHIAPGCEGTKVQPAVSAFLDGK